MAAGSHSDKPSNTRRGQMVREQLLCQDVPAPPPGVNANLPPADGRARPSRQTFARHTTDASCAACHNLMDPIGWGLSGFDAAGAMRTKDSNGQPLSVKGQINGMTPPDFNGPVELGQKLAASPEFKTCFAHAALPLRLRPRRDDGRRAGHHRAAGRVHDGELGPARRPRGARRQRRLPLPQPGRRAMSLKPHQMTRRTFLRAAGISVALPTLDAMIDGRGHWLREARAATPPPVRVMAFHFPHGVVLSQWTPATTGTGYAMTPGLMPLAAYQNDINVISNLEQLCWGKGPGGGHANGMPDFATAVVSIGTGAGGPSFDQVLAAELGAATKFRSLVGHREQADGATEGATTAHMNNVCWAAARHAGARRSRSDALLHDARLGRAAGVDDDGVGPDARGAGGGRAQEERARPRHGRDQQPADAASARSTRRGSTTTSRACARSSGSRRICRRWRRTTSRACRPSRRRPTRSCPTRTARRSTLRMFALAFRCDLTRYASMAQSNGYDSRVYTDSRATSAITTASRTTATTARCRPRSR